MRQWFPIKEIGKNLLGHFWLLQLKNPPGIGGWGPEGSNGLKYIGQSADELLSSSNASSNQFDKPK